MMEQILWNIEKFAVFVAYLFCVNRMKKKKKNSFYKAVNLSIIMSPPVGLGDILFLPWSSVRPSVCNSKTVWDIFMKLSTNIKQHETTCRAQEPYLWIAYFWSYGPLKLKIVDFAIGRVHSVTQKPFKIPSWNLIQILTNIRRHAERKNHNCCIYTFWVMPLWTL